jgi:hypothetical protein
MPIVKQATAGLGSIGNRDVVELSVRWVTQVNQAQKTRPSTQYDVNDLASPGY